MCQNVILCTVLKANSSFDVLLATKGCCGQKTCKQGVIQQLRGPNFTQFWPPTLLECTIKDILYTSYRLFSWPSVDLSTDHQPNSSCPHSYWMTPWQAPFAELVHFCAICMRPMQFHHSSSLKSKTRLVALYFNTMVPKYLWILIMISEDIC